MTAVFTPAYNPQQWLQPDDRALPEASPLEKKSIDRANRQLDLRIKPFRRKLDALYHPYRQRLMEERLAQVPEVIREDLRIALKSFENELRPPERYLKEKFEPVIVPSEAQIQSPLEPGGAGEGPRGSRVGLPPWNDTAGTMAPCRPRWIPDRRRQPIS